MQLTRHARHIRHASKLLLSAFLMGNFFSVCAIAADAPPVIITLPKEQDVMATVTLLKREGDVGRSSMVIHNYRPQVAFSAPRSQITCALKFPDQSALLEPGQSMDIAINCTDVIRLVEGKPEFAFYEGGRKVGVGKLKQ